VLPILLFVAVVATARPALAAQPGPPAASERALAHEGGGEANLVLPDLSTVEFRGVNGRSLLMGGLAICALGLLFGLLTFTELKALTETTDGNLSVHARRLEDAGYVRCTKGFEGRTPKTEFALTDAGRGALRRYLDHMEAIIRHARPKTRT